MQQYQLIARWLKGEIPQKILPWQIDIDTTNICNQACFYCNTEQFRKDNPVFQTFEKYDGLIEKLFNWRKHDPEVIGTTSNIIFSGGGEPTLLPHYEKLIEKSIDYGFLVAMNTNGKRLYKLLNINPDKIKRMAYIGLDIDSAIPETYEAIRRSKTRESPFNLIKDTAIQLGKMNAPIDIKALLMPQNTSEQELNELFNFAKQVNARAVHLRPVVLDGKNFIITPAIVDLIQSASARTGIKSDLALGRYDARQYKHCHQMFLFPSFCADGNVYVCCEYKGREDLKLGSWIEGDFRDIWCGEAHKEIYKNFKTDFCKPCRPNTTNNAIDFSLNNRTDNLKGFI